MRSHGPSYEHYRYHTFKPYQRHDGYCIFVILDQACPELVEGIENLLGRSHFPELEILAGVYPRLRSMARVTCKNDVQHTDYSTVSECDVHKPVELHVSMSVWASGRYERLL